MENKKITVKCDTNAQKTEVIKFARKDSGLDPYEGTDNTGPYIVLFHSYKEYVGTHSFHTDFAKSNGHTIISYQEFEQKYLNKGLIIGEYYYYNDWIFIHVDPINYKCNNTCIYIGLEDDDDEPKFYNANAAIADINNSKKARPATPDEKQWLDACIKANKFIPKEQALKPIFEVGKYYKFNVYDNTAFIKCSKVVDNQVYSSYYYYQKRNLFYDNEGAWGTISTSNVEEITQEEMSKYLPDNHPDKIKSMKNLVGRWVKCLEDGANACIVNGKGVLKGEYYQLEKVDKKDYRLRNGNYCGYLSYGEDQAKWNCSGFELMPEGWSPEETFKVGDWVVFLPEKAKELGYYTTVWNKPFVLKVDKISSDTLTFNNDTATKAGMDISGYSLCSNDVKCFRKALPHEIPDRIKKYPLTPEECYKERCDTVPKYVKCIKNNIGGCKKGGIFKAKIENNVFKWLYEKSNVDRYFGQWDSYSLSWEDEKRRGYFIPASEEEYEAQSQPKYVVGVDPYDKGLEVLTEVLVKGAENYLSHNQINVDNSSLINIKVRKSAPVTLKNAENEVKINVKPQQTIKIYGN